MRELVIAGRRIADDEPCYVIAEIGHNHGGSVETAKTMIRRAARAGVSAVKLQKRDNANLYSPAMLATPYSHEHSYGATYGEHRAALELTIPEYEACFETARGAAVSCFATAFDEISADQLLAIGTPALKIASGSLTDYNLLRYVSTMAVPIILSTGGGDARDIDKAVSILGAHTEVALLHCTAAYPVLEYAELNLRCIQTLRDRYPDTVIGWSGHDSGIAMALVAWSLGARIIEKHFTLNRAGKGTDHAFSLEPSGLSKLCQNLDRAHVALGDGIKRAYPSEAAPLSKMRRTWVNGMWQVGSAQERTMVHA